MIDGRRMAGAATSAVKGRQRLDGVEGRLGRRHQEVPLVPVDQQHWTVQRFESSDVVPLRTRVEHADRVHARVCSQLDRQEPSTGLAHDRHPIECDLALQRRPRALVLRFGPVDGLAQVVGRGPAARCTRLGGRRHHQEAVRCDRGQEPAVASAVDRAPAVAPDHHGQRISGWKRREIRRPVDHMTRRAEGWSGFHFVGPRHGERRALHGQRRGDHLGRDTGRTLSVGYASERKGDGRTKDD